MNTNDAYRSIGSGTVRRNDIDGVVIALLEEVSPWGLGFEVSEAQARPSGSQSLPAAWGSRY